MSHHTKPRSIPLGPSVVPRRRSPASSSSSSPSRRTSTKRKYTKFTRTRCVLARPRPTLGGIQRPASLSPLRIRRRVWRHAERPIPVRGVARAPARRAASGPTGPAVRCVGFCFIRRALVRGRTVGAGGAVGAVRARGFGRAVRIAGRDVRGGIFHRRCRVVVGAAGGAGAVGIGGCGARHFIGVDAVESRGGERVPRPRASVCRRRRMGGASVRRGACLNPMGSLASYIS